MARVELAVWLLVALALTAAPASWAADVQAQAMTAPLATGAACADPPWLVHGLDAYRRDSCQGRAWALQNVGRVGGTDRTLEGRRLVVTYVVASGTQRLTGPKVQHAFLDAFRSMGAEVLTPEDNQARLVAKQITPAGEFWFIYEPGGGSADALTSFTLATWMISPLRQEVQARALTGPLPKDGGCADPPWLVKPLSGYRRDGCDAKDWTTQTLGGLRGGNRTLEGSRQAVTYIEINRASTQTGSAVQHNFLAAFKAIGATIVSNEDDEGRVVATQTTPVGEVWYTYEAGGGDMDTRTSYTLATMVIAPFVQEVQARAMAEGLQPPGKTCADPPWLAKQFASYKLGSCDYQDFAPLTVKLPDGERSLVGRVLSVNYEVADRDHVRIAAAVWRNYVDALQAMGAKLVSDPKDISVAVLTQRVGPGDYWYIYRMGNGSVDAVINFALQTLQIGGPPSKACTMEVYGVNFDFDKAVLRPDSMPVLKQVLALFTGNPEFAAEVGGHTDNIGKPQYNLTLSNARAAAVKSWLVAHGIAAGRVSSHGYGDTQPLVPNTTDENRFKNRRVELKRANCNVAG